MPKIQPFEINEASEMKQRKERERIRSVVRSLSPKSID